MKNKKLPIIIATLALVLSGCVNRTQSSSIFSSENSTVSSEEIISSSDVISSSNEEYSSSEDVSSSSEVSSTVVSSSEIISSSSLASSSAASSSSAQSSSSSTASSSSSSSSSSTSYSVPPVNYDSNWNIDLSLRGAAFRNALQTIMAGKRTKTTDYSSCLSIGAKAAAYPNANSSTFVPFYHDASLTTTTSECNREHTWPNSRGSGTSGPGADPFIIRPTLKEENTSRGNLFYGTGSNEWDPASCGFTGARGESARVILYAATMYYKNGLSLSNNPRDDKTLHTMGTLSTLLAWNTTYAPTPIEIQVNNYLSNNGYGRNPFVDHPEYANYIWSSNGLLGEEIPPTPVDFTNGLDRETSLNNLDGNEFVIASTDSSTSTTYFAMDNQAKSSDLPWYIKPLDVLLNDDKTKLIPDAGVTLKYYKFIKQSDGNYYIQSKETNDYLYGYIDGTHYSIGLGSSPIHDGSLSWTITTSNNGFVFKNAASVYLEYFRESFCGYKNAPGVPIYLYN